MSGFKEERIDGCFVRTTYSGKGWACDMTGVDQGNFVHGRWTRMVDSHMSANESILYDIEDKQRVFIVYF